MRPRSYNGRECQEKEPEKKATDTFFVNKLKEQGIKMLEAKRFMFFFSQKDLSLIGSFFINLIGLETFRSLHILNSLLLCLPLF